MSNNGRESGTSVLRLINSILKTNIIDAPQYIAGNVYFLIILKVHLVTGPRRKTQYAKPRA